MNQAHYERLGDFVATSVAELIEKEFDLERVMLPLEQDRGRCPMTFPILHSKDLATNPKIIVFVLGAGKVELGQWSRSLCMNKTLAEGSLMLFIHEAIRVRGCAVLLTNPNVNYWMNPRTKRLNPIPENGDPEAHLYYLYKNFLEQAAATEIAIIAHSFGGVSTMNLLSKNDAVTDLLGDKGRLKSITFTDSVHSASMGSPLLSKATKKWLLANAINFIRSSEPLGTPYIAQSATQRCSAGSDDHAYTSYACRSLLWKWLDARMGTGNDNVIYDAPNIPAPEDEDATSPDNTKVTKKKSKKPVQEGAEDDKEAQEDAESEEKPAKRGSRSKATKADEQEELEEGAPAPTPAKKKKAKKASEETDKAEQMDVDQDSAPSAAPSAPSEEPASELPSKNKSRSKRKREDSTSEASASEGGRGRSSSSSKEPEVDADMEPGNAKRRSRKADKS